jgi:hypothetical protein
MLGAILVLVTLFFLQRHSILLQVSNIEIATGDALRAIDEHHLTEIDTTKMPKEDALKYAQLMLKVADETHCYNMFVDAPGDALIKRLVPDAKKRLTRNLDDRKRSAARCYGIGERELLDTEKTILDRKLEEIETNPTALANEPREPIEMPTLKVCSECNGKKVVKSPYLEAAESVDQDCDKWDKLYGSSHMARGEKCRTSPCPHCRATGHEIIEPTIGMTDDQAIKCMGKPSEINRTTTAGADSEQWVYRSFTDIGKGWVEDHHGNVKDVYVYINNGVVTGVQD